MGTHSQLFVCISISKYGLTTVGLYACGTRVGGWCSQGQCRFLERIKIEGLKVQETHEEQNDPWALDIEMIYSGSGGIKEEKRLN